MGRGGRAVQVCHHAGIPGARAGHAPPDVCHGVKRLPRDLRSKHQPPVPGGMHDAVQGHAQAHEAGEVGIGVRFAAPLVAAVGRPERRGGDHARYAVGVEGGQHVEAVAVDDHASGNSVRAEG